MRRHFSVPLEIRARDFLWPVECNQKRQVSLPVEALRARARFATFLFYYRGDHASVRLDLYVAIMNTSSLLRHNGDRVKAGPRAFMTPTVGAFLNSVP